MSVTFSLLALAVLSLWFRPGSFPHHKWLWLGLTSASAISGVFERVLDPLGVGMSLAYAGLVFAFVRTKTGWRNVAMGSVVLVMSVALLLHRLPGFHNFKVIDSVRFTTDALPFTLYLNYDKTLVALFIIGFSLERISTSRDWLVALAAFLPLAAGLVLVVMVLSLTFGYVRLAPKFPAQAGYWLFSNLFFTCSSEEAFFRGFLQTQLQRLFAPVSNSAIWAIVVAGISFGIAHLAGGWTYVLLASVAGLGYGWIYLQTRRIEASILAHFTLNATHFFLFTYPALASKH